LFLGKLNPGTIFLKAGFIDTTNRLPVSVGITLPVVSASRQGLNDGCPVYGQAYLVYPELCNGLSYQ